MFQKKSKNKRIHLPSRGHIILKEAQQARKQGDIDKAYQLCDKAIQTFRVLLKMRPYDFKAREGLTKAWGVAGLLLPGLMAFEKPVLIPEEWSRDPQFNTIWKWLKTCKSRIEDGLFENEWREQCVGKYGGDKPKQHTWREFYLKTESTMEQLRGTDNELKWAIEKGHLNYVKNYLKRIENMTPRLAHNIGVEKAVLNQDQDMLNLLFDYNLPVDLMVNHHWSLLHFAVFTGNKALVLQLLNKGASPQSQDRNGLSPLFWAIYLDDLSIVQALFQNGALVNDVLRSGLTPLALAVCKGNLSIVQACLQQGASLEYTHPCQYGLLHLASVRGHHKLCKRLLEAGASPNRIDIFSRSPLHWASQFNHYQVRQTLKAHGAKTAILDRYGMTPDTLKQRRY